MVLAGITGTAVYVCICEELVHLVSKLVCHEYFNLLMSLLLRWAIFRQSGGFSFASCFACSGIVDLHFHEPAKGFSLFDSGLWLDVCGWWIQLYLVEPKKGIT